MNPIFTTLAPGLFEAGARLIDRLIPDPTEREKAKLALLQAEGQQALQEMQVSLSAILAEANSLDPWTSRARPTFLYARVRHQNADFAFLVKPLPCESTTYAHFCGSFVVATA